MAGTQTFLFFYRAASQSTLAFETHLAITKLHSPSERRVCHVRT
jgi:hypothetical protein